MTIRLLAAAGVAAVGASVALAPVATASPQDFQNCLNKHGVTVQLPPHPPTGQKPPKAGEVPPAPPGVDQKTWATAFKACQKYAPPPPR